MIDLIKSIVLNIREILDDEYDTMAGGDFEGYRGLCDKSYIMFKKEIKKINVKYKMNLEVIHFHGEQKHTPKINPMNWCYQHTWAGIRNDSGDIIYVDPTCQQFKWLYNDIPDYYISVTPPPWYISDRDNIFFKVYRKNEWIAINVIGKIDYYIWGGICKLYRKVLKIK
jgi:hypothetical protein